MPPGAGGIVLFAHGSGSSRHSPRNRFEAEVLQAAGLAALLIDLITTEEEVVDARTAHLRFDIGLLGNQLGGATDRLQAYPDTRPMRIGYFGASIGSAAALVAAARRPEGVHAIVSRVAALFSRRTPCRWSVRRHSASWASGTSSCSI